jgi:hypothetical protein
MKNYLRVKALFLIFSFTLILVSCSKDKDKNADKTKSLTSGNWKITAMTSTPAMDWDGDGDDETDMMGAFETCELDDYVTFKADGTGDSNQGASKCDPSDPQSSPFEWSFEDNESKLIIDGEEYVIVELTGTVFKAKQTYNYGPVTITTEVTFSH